MAAQVEFSQGAMVASWRVTSILAILFLIMSTQAYVMPSKMIFVVDSFRVFIVHAKKETLQNHFW